MTKKEKREKGICWDCNEPVAPGRTRCARHLSKSAASTKLYIEGDKGKAYLERTEPARKKRSAGYNRVRRRGAGRYLYVKGHARRRGYAMDLSEEEYYALIALPCDYCGLENNVEAGVGLDRLDNAYGYVKSNVVSCCVECNLARGDRFSPSEMKIVGKAIAKVKRLRLSSVS